MILPALARKKTKHSDKSEKPNKPTQKWVKTKLLPKVIQRHLISMWKGILVIKVILWLKSKEQDLVSGKETVSVLVRCKTVQLL